jgi:phosphomannomutase
MSLTVRDLMDQTGVAFGTSGARGLVYAMTDRLSYGCVQGFLSYLAEVGEFAQGGEVALAGDLRPSTPRILRAAAEAIRDMGGQPVFCGHVPTPALAYYAFERRIPSLMVTGSHIPDDRNGIKFHRSTGEILKPDEAGVLEQTLTLDASRFSADGALIDAAPLPAAEDAGKAYLRRYLDVFGDEALAGLRIGVYQHSAVGRDLVVSILRALGAEATPLGRSDAFVPVDTEALRAEDVDAARRWAAELPLDAIVSTDGDSDRPLISDARGAWLRGDVLGLLTARELAADCIVTPVSSTTALERSGAFSRVIRTRIGSPYVIEAMEAAARERGGVVCGFEANGGFLLGTSIARGSRVLTALPTRDAVLPIVAVLAAARTRSVADLCADLPKRATASDRLEHVATADSRAMLDWLVSGGGEARKARIEAEFGTHAGRVTRIDETDGLRVTFDGGAIIHLRPSGNAPELRCYAEAEDEAGARRLADAALAHVRDTLIPAARARRKAD